MAPPSKTAAIVDEITRKIESGDLKSGDRLPGTTEMMSRYNASVVTIRIAVGRLKAAGLVETVPGVGTYVR